MATMIDVQRHPYRRIQGRELDDPSQEIGFGRSLLRPQGWTRHHFHVAMPSRDAWLECELIHHVDGTIIGSHR